MATIVFVLRTGCQWKALNETKICARSSTHRRFQAWMEADGLVAVWKQGIIEYEAWEGMDGAWLALDGAMTRVPLGGGKVGKYPTDRGKIGTKRRGLTDGCGVPVGLAVAGAHRHDCQLTRETIARLAVKRPDAPQTPPRGGAWTKARSMTRCGRGSMHAASRPLSGPRARKPKR
jgi:putative transposase